MWHEDTLPNRSIKGILDEVFVADILPEIIMQCKGLYSLLKILPYREELLTLLDTFTNYIEKLFESHG